MGTKKGRELPGRGEGRAGSCQAEAQEARGRQAADWQTLRLRRRGKGRQLPVRGEGGKGRAGSSQAEARLTGEPG